jgi:1,4-alpha-glucan branching enzyme
LLNSDAESYGGGGMGNFGGVAAEDIPTHGRPFSLNLTLPPLGAVFLKGEAPGA